VKKGDELVEVGWDEAIAHAASELKGFRKSEIAAIGSPFATNEENYLFQKFCSEVLGTRHIDFVRHVVEGEQDDLLIRADKAPNSSGAEEVGVRPRDGGLDVSGMIKAILEGKIKALYLLDEQLTLDASIITALAKLELLVLHSSNESGLMKYAEVVLPCSTFAEKHGTFTNFQGRVQRIKPSVAALEADRALDGFAMSRLDKFGTQFDRWARGTKRDVRPTWRIISSMANLMGAKYRYNTSEDVFNEIASTVPAFKGMSYMKIGNKGMMLRVRHEKQVQPVG
jgi:predicted molibdopterin-dependent oxidoreductase YjgC